VLNGVVAVPIMAVMMVVVTNSAQMGRFRAARSLALCGWGATGLMALTVLAMFWSFLI
jgi:Mn2+/Fe2+ NRAMP family transporter